MRDLNHVTLVARLVADPELKTFASGAVCKIRVAVNNSKKNTQTGKWEDVPCFIGCQIWDRGDNKQATRLSEMVTKGQRLGITGRLLMDEWTDKTTNQKRSQILIDMDDFYLIEKKSDAVASASSGESQEGPPSEPSGESIPF